jgi:thioredoxin-related protein
MLIYGKIMIRSHFLKLVRVALLTAICSTLFSTSDGFARSPVEDGSWAKSPESAIASAKKEKKDLLLLFTGSDWCPPCKKLEQEVFSDDSFYDEAATFFVFLKFDFLRNSPLPDDVSKLNDQWAEKFGVDSFPTVVLVDENLKPYAFAGYEEGGVENFLGMLEESRQIRVTRDEKMALAEKATGDARAKLLDEALAGLPREISEVYYGDIIKEIVKLDEDDELGLRTRWNEENDKELRKVILTDVMMIARLESPARAIQLIDELLAEIKFTAKQRLEIMQMKLSLLREKGDDIAKVDQIMDDMINLEGVEDATRERLIVKKIFLMVGSNRRTLAMKTLDNAIDEGEKNGRANAYLWACKGELLFAEKKYEAAVTAYDRAIIAAAAKPDVLVEVVSGKADALFADKKEAESLQTLDEFADNTDLPGDLRAEALLHKSMLLRESGKLRTARLVENRAIEIIESTKERSELQSVVERLRRKFEDQ